MLIFVRSKLLCSSYCQCYKWEREFGETKCLVTIFGNYETIAMFEKIRNRLSHEKVADEHGLESLKTMSSTSSRGCHSLRQLRPTRWTVKGDAMQSVLDNYEAVLLCLEEIAQEDKAEAGSKASRLANIFTKFDTFCSLKIGILLFQQVEQLSRLLQKKSLVASAAKAAAQILISSLTGMRSEHFFHNFWLKITHSAIDLKLEHSQVPRSRRPSSFLDSGYHLHSLLILKAFIESNSIFS